MFLYETDGLWEPRTYLTSGQFLVFLIHLDVIPPSDQGMSMFPFTPWWAPPLLKMLVSSNCTCEGECACVCVCLCVCAFASFFWVLVNLVIESVFMLMRVLVCMSVFVVFFVCVWVCFLCIYSHGQDAHVEQNPILCVFLLMNVSRYKFALVCFFCVCVFVLVCVCLFCLFVSFVYPHGQDGRLECVAHMCFWSPEARWARFRQNMRL